MSVEDIDRVGDEEGRTKIQTKGITFSGSIMIWVNFLTVQRATFERENFRKFRGFWLFVKVFSCESCRLL